MAQYAYPVRTGASKHVVEANGKKLTLAEWSKELQIPLSVLIVRWNRGWADDEILRPTVNSLREKFSIPDPMENPIYAPEEDEAEEED